MEHSVYNTCNEDAILKYVGPYRLISGEQSLSGFLVPEDVIVGAPSLVGDSIMYKVTIIGQESAVEEE